MVHLCLFVQVTILPHDPPESRLWVDVFVGHHRHSSRDTHTTDEAPAHEAAEEQGERSGAATKMGEMLINPGEERSVQVELHAFYGAEIGCVAKVRHSPPDDFLCGSKGR